MKHTLDINRDTSLGFVKKAHQFLELPKKLCECDIKKCNPDLYKGKKGVIAIARSKKALVVIKRIEVDLNKLKKILK